MTELFHSSNGIEEPLEESSHEPEPEPESETKTEELKPQVEEKHLEDLEEKSATPPPVEPASLPQEPPKVSEMIKGTFQIWDLVFSYLVPLIKHGFGCYLE